MIKTGNYRDDLYNLAMDKITKDKKEHADKLEHYVEKTILAPCLSSAMNGHLEKKFKKSEIVEDFTYEEIAESLVVKNLTVTDCDKYFPDEFTVSWDKI